MSKEKIPGDPSLPSSDEYLQHLIEMGEGEHNYMVEDFFRRPMKTGFQLSPDGTHFSYLRPYQRRQNIFIQRIGSLDAHRITHETDRDIAGYFWANNNRIVFLKDNKGDENFRLYGVDKDGDHLIDLTPASNIRIQIIDPLEDIEDELIIGMNKNNPQLFEPYRINIRTGAYEQIGENTNPLEPITGWMTDHKGQLRIAMKLEGGTNTTLMYRESEKEHFAPVITTDFRESLSPLFFDFDNENIVYATSNIGRDKSAIVKFDMGNGKETGVVIFEHPEVDVQSLSYSKKRKVALTVFFTTTKRKFHFLDGERAQLQKRLEAELGDYEIVITDCNKEEDKYLIRTYSDRSLGAYYFYDKTKDRLELLALVSPWIEEDDMAIMEAVKYPARDGTIIHAYLSLPSGGPQKGLPFVILPHGGPWVRDTWGFDPEVQLLTSRGYGVLKMNYRGSTGYGRDFWEKGFKQWGKAMQDDISDGVEWLIEKGFAAPSRIAIYGGSYGGYATLAGLAFTPDLYACGIDYVGVSNLFTFLNTIPPYWEPFREMMYTMVGHPEKDKEAMEATSPALNSHKIKAPLFVVQGANDPRVNIDESDQIVRSMRARGIEVPYMVKYNEGHGFRNEENQFEFYKAMLGFLAKHLHAS